MKRFSRQGFVKASVKMLTTMAVSKVFKTDGTVPDKNNIKIKLYDLEVIITVLLSSQS